MKTWICLSLICAQGVIATPKETAFSRRVAVAPEKTDQILYAPLHGIFLVGSNKDLKVSGLENVEGVEIENLDLPGDLWSLDQEFYEYWGKPIQRSDLIEIKRRIISYYRNHNRPVIYVLVPAQSPGSGVLQFVVFESRMGEVRSTGNRYFSTKQLEKAIQLKKGDRIRADVLLKDLSWINKNPFRTTDLVFTASDTSGFTDIELVTRDQFPVRFYTGVDNTGIAQSGHNRWFAGFNWGNAFFLDHIFTYQFTSGSHYDEFWAHSVNYSAPLSWHHTLDVYGGYSQCKAALQGAPGVLTMGNSAQGSLRYNVPLPKALSLHEWIFGLDWKRTNTNIINNGLIIFGKIANIFQFVAGLNGGFETTRTKHSGTLEVFCSPGRWLPNQENSNYNDLRTGAKNRYAYGRLSLSSIFQLPSRFTLEPMLRLQLSSENLLASEQFGVGGYNTVRGYEEREANGDNALLFNLELKTPPMRLLALSEKIRRKLCDDLRLLVFFDYGYAQNHKSFLNEKEFEYLIGVGPGLRYRIDKYLMVRLDYGWKLHQIDPSQNPLRHMLYFGSVVSF